MILIPIPHILLLSKKYFGVGIWDLGVGLSFMITFFISSYYYLVQGHLSIFESGESNTTKEKGNNN
jgi:hypothetical protein